MMTEAEMIQETMAHWVTYHRAALNKMPKEERLEQATACARLTRMEMDSLKAIGLDEETAWVEARNLFCLTRPPKYDPQQTP